MTEWGGERIGLNELLGCRIVRKYCRLDLACKRLRAPPTPTRYTRTG